MDDMVNIKEDISKLRSAYLLIQGILQEVEENQIDNVDIQKWLSDLVDIGYEARDVVEDFTTNCSVVKAERSPKSPHPIPKDNIGCSSSDQLAKDIKHVRERFDEKMKQSETFATSKSIIGGSSKSVPVYRRPKTGPFFNKQRDLFVGRRDVKEGIMKKLLDYSDNHVHVVPIWGMGGIGKTTLAQSIYNDERVKEEDYPTKNRRWLCVGEKKFNTEEIIAKIIEEPCPDVDRIKEKLVEKFKGDKFLIVLDDVWELNNTEWNLLWDLLTNVGKGGVIIITTRIREIIIATNTKVSNDLEPLSYEDCWKIFKRYAFADQNTNDKSDERLIIGRDIAIMLKGLPLAAKVVGRSLLNEPDATTWRNFLEAQEWKLRNGEDHIIPTLRWSYNLLPPHLKQCFTYCALFPKDHVFDEKELVEMWMAHDFILKEEKKRPEDIGAQYFKELVNASLLQCVYGKYVMHDMIHDLALLVSNEEFVTANALLSTDKMEKARHITIIHDDDDYLKNLNLCKSKRLLTLYIKENYSLKKCSYKDQLQKEKTCSYKDILRDVFNHLKSIRVLVLESTIYIPDCICELRHLRYLDISKTRHLESTIYIPDCINLLDSLHNLQTFAAPLDAILPKNIVNITSLRCVRANLPTYKGVGKLTSLQEVSSISVSEDGNIRELGDLRELHGKLIIEGLENVTSSQDAAGALMQDKIHIDQLTLVFKRDLGNTAVVTEVLDALRCPPNLTYLKIQGYNGLTLPPLGELSYLKHLSLQYMNGVERFGDELYGKGIDGKVFFPSLEVLCLEYMNKWKEWDGILIEDTSASFFPRLTKLNIHDCSELVSVLPTYNLKDKHPITTAANFMRSLSELRIRGCNGLELLQLDGLVSLKHLEIDACDNLTRISAKHFPITIEELSISDCTELIEMEFESFPSLKKLEIRDCNKLISVPRLVKIEYLNVRWCEHLSLLRFNLQGINSVKDLCIRKCPILKLIVEEGSAAASCSSSSSTTVSLPSEFQDDMNILKKYRFEEDAQGRMALKKMHNSDGNDTWGISGCGCGDGGGERWRTTAMGYDDGGADVMEGGGSSSFPPQVVDENAMSLMNVRTKETTEAGLYPERPGEPDCAYYIRTGLCRFGMTCKFNHPINRKLAVATARMKGGYPERIGQPECQYYLKTGTCKFGATCKFHHPKHKAGIVGRAQLNSLGYPLRPNETECLYYLRTGQCKFENTCKFHHPQPSNAMVSLRRFFINHAVQSPTSRQLSYSGATNWPMSSASYIPSPRWQGPSSYTQMILPDGLVQVPGWNTYLGQLWPVSSPENRQHSPGNAQLYGSSRQSESSNTVTQGLSLLNHLHHPPLRQLREENRIYKKHSDDSTATCMQVENTEGF